MSLDDIQRLLRGLEVSATSWVLGLSHSDTSLVHSALCCLLSTSARVMCEPRVPCLSSVPIRGSAHECSHTRMRTSRARRARSRKPARARSLARVAARFHAASQRFHSLLALMQFVSVTSRMVFGLGNFRAARNVIGARCLRGRRRARVFGLSRDRLRILRGGVLRRRPAGSHRPSAPP